jgi:hypothetical protein
MLLANAGLTRLRRCGAHKRAQPCSHTSALQLDKRLHKARPLRRGESGQIADVSAIAPASTSATPASPRVFKAEVNFLFTTTASAEQSAIPRGREAPPNNFTKFAKTGQGYRNDWGSAFKSIQE